MARAAKQTTAVVKWEEELAKYAEAAAANEVSGGGSFLSVKQGRLSYKGNEVPGSKLNVIVLDSVFENHWYADAYDADTPQSPACFAFGRTEKGMAPHDKSPDKQNDECEGCPQNEFGSAERGRGKACKNVRRLAMILAEEAENGNIADAEVFFLKVPVTSVKSWAGYVQQLSSTLRRPPFAVVTEVMAEPDNKTQLRVQFKYVEQFDDGAILKALVDKRAALGDEGIMFPYSTIEAEEAPKGKKPVRRKKY